MNFEIFNQHARLVASQFSLRDGLFFLFVSPLLPPARGGCALSFLQHARLVASQSRGETGFFYLCPRRCLPSLTCPSRSEPVSQRDGLFYLCRRCCFLHEEDVYLSFLFSYLLHEEDVDFVLFLAHFPDHVFGRNCTAD